MKPLRLAREYWTLLLAANPSKAEVGLIVAGTISAVVSGVPFPIVGILFGQLLNDFNSATCASSNSTQGAHYQSYADGKILIIFYLAIAQFVTIYGHLLCWSITGERLSQRLREKYLKGLLRQEALYFDSLPTGEIASRLNGDIAAIRSGTSEKVGICIAALSFFVTAYVVAFIKDVTLAAILISLVPAYLVMSLVGSHYIEKYSGLMSEAAAKASSIASEALNNVMVVQAFGASSRLEELFAQAQKTSEREGIKKALAVGIQSGVLYFIAYAANGLAFWQGSIRIAESVKSGTSGLSVGAVFTVIFVLVEATLLFSQIAPFLHLFSAAVASFGTIKEVLDRDSLIDGTSTSGTALSHLQGGYEFEDVTFSYPSRSTVPVLRKLNISIPLKKHTAIVGLSGSGKSTIASLLARLYDPADGRILLDGNNIHDLNVRNLRSWIGLVEQEPPLLECSILENIAHGLINSGREEHAGMQSLLLGPELATVAAEMRVGRDITGAADRLGGTTVEVVKLVKRAAELADADSFIAGLQHGYGTLVGSSGTLVSGGQRSRIALARALVKDPVILILDEATASLDSQSEQRIMKALLQHSEERTTVTIAHRLATVRNADNIIVLDKGEMAEQGSHADLMAKEGTYAKLVKAQTGGTSSEDVGVATDDDAKKDMPESRSPDGHAEKETQSHETPSDAAPMGEEEEESAELPAPKRSLWSLTVGYAPALRPHLLTIVIAALGAVIVGGAFSGEAVIFGNTVGSLSPCKTPTSIRSSGRFFGLMFFVLALIEFFANVASWVGFGMVSEKVIYSLRVLSFRSLFEQDLQWHQSENRSPARLLSYITNDGAALAGFGGSVIGTLFSITVNLFGSIILTNIIAWKIALVCLALVPFLLGAGIMELLVLAAFEEKHESAYTKSINIGVEAVSSIRTVAAYGLEETTIRTYRRSLTEPRKAIVKVILQASLWQAMTYFLGNCVNALAYWWGAKQIIAGNYDQVQFLIVVFSLLVGALLWSQMFALAPELTNARAAMARILSLIELGSTRMLGKLDRQSSAEDEKTTDLEAEVESKSSNLGEKSAMSVQLQDVVFSYPARPDITVLNGLSIDIKPGQFCALVGASGSGKSTTIALIERLYTPQSGAILLNGDDVTKRHDLSFRDDIALVPQSSMLFEGSVEFNISLGARPGQQVSRKDVEDACRLANIHEVIQALPDGYKTPCGSGGNAFSGGQRQRLSIARALVRKPKLLILDEPTSALDAESEQMLQDGFDQAMDGITVIVIAHRLRTIRRADTIALMEAGRIVDVGTHSELLARSPAYRDNVMHQTGEVQ